MQNADSMYDFVKWSSWRSRLWLTWRPTMKLIEAGIAHKDTNNFQDTPRESQANIGTAKLPSDQKNSWVIRVWMKLWEDKWILQRKYHTAKKINWNDTPRYSKYFPLCSLDKTSASKSNGAMYHEVLSVKKNSKEFPLDTLWNSHL